MTHVTFQLDLELLNAVRERCKAEGLTLSGLLRRLLREWLDELG